MTRSEKLALLEDVATEIEEMCSLLSRCDERSSANYQSRAGASMVSAAIRRVVEKSKKQGWSEKT